MSDWESAVLDSERVMPVAFPLSARQNAELDGN
jgi:hypothetical protein